MLGVSSSEPAPQQPEPTATPQRVEHGGPRGDRAHRGHRGHRGVRRTLSRWLHSPRVWRRASWIALLLLVPSAVWLALDSGTTWDEEVHRRYGAAILRWFETGFEDRTATTLPQHVYGGLFDLIGAFIADLEVIPLGIFDLLHVLTALLALVGLVVTWQLAACVGGPIAGFFAAAYLCLTPMWVGHGWFNPKDIPFAVGGALTLHAAARVCLAPAPLSWGLALRVGLCTGLALSIRPGGLFMCAYPLAAAGGRMLLDALMRWRSAT
ncbi:MAG: hypothetical protein ABW321_09320, partial [Polyangiales bacterium]